uniref:Isoform 2 of Dual specificity protein phosphatase 2 n=1 Tax=Mus musculus TaxID=10090 RepID=Q05922-2
MPIAMGLETACELECAALGALLREPREAERTLLLDCRPFLAFCRSHVRAARPVPWNALLRRRARGTPAAALACLLPDRALRARLGRGELARAVVLDESSASVAELPPDGPAHLLLAALQHEMRGGPTTVCFLRGGFKSFQTYCPDLCSEAPAQALPPAGAENSNSDPRVPIYDQVSSDL